MFTRKELVEYSVKKWCNRDLTSKGMAINPQGDVFCVATLSGDYPNQIYYRNGRLLPKEAYYCGVYCDRAANPFDMNYAETRKNIAVTKTDGKTRFVYFFEKTEEYSDEYFFHGRYKYVDYKHIKPEDPEKKYVLIFHLAFVDSPIIHG